MESTLKSDMAEMMNGWNEIEASAKKQFPKATKEELFKITSDAMNHVLGIKSPYDLRTVGTVEYRVDSEN